MYGLDRQELIASNESTWPKCPVCGLKQPRGGFTCPKCPPSVEKVSFSYQIQLMVHLADFHNSQLPAVLPCEICNDRFNSSDDLLQHILIEEHACSSEHLTCSCDVMFMFDTEEHLQTHQRTHAVLSENVEMNSGIVTIQHPVQPGGFLPNTLSVTSLALPRASAPSLLPSPYSHLLSAHSNALQSQPLFHLNVNTNFYPYNNSMGNRLLSLPTPGVALNGLQKTVNKTAEAIVALHNQQLQSSKRAEIAVKQANQSTNDLAIEVTNDAAKILLSKKYPCVVPPRVCAFCSRNFDFSKLVDLITCDICPKSFMNLYDLLFHKAERHNYKIDPHLLSSPKCPVDGCEYSLQDPGLAQNFMQHYKVFHINEGCLYHYVCSRASCRQVFGSLVGINSHDQFCKSNLSKMMDKSYYVSCWSCLKTFYPCSITKCLDCDIFLGDEKDFALHRAEEHDATIDPPCQGSFGKTSLCKIHYICFNKLCRIITSNQTAFEMHKKECIYGPAVQASPSVISSSKKAIVPSGISVTPETTQQRIDQMREALHQSQVKKKTSSSSTERQEPAYRTHLASVESAHGSHSVSVSKTIKREKPDIEDAGHFSRKRSRFHDKDEDCPIGFNKDTDEQNRSAENLSERQSMENAASFEELDEDLERTAVAKDNYKTIYDSGEIENEEHLALIENPASSSAWDDVMDNLLAYTDSIDV